MHENAGARVVFTSFDACDQRDDVAFVRELIHGSDDDGDAGPDGLWVLPENPFASRVAFPHDADEGAERLIRLNNMVAGYTVR